MWTSYKVQTEGPRTDGTILEIGPAKDGSEYHLRIEVRFDDGKTVEFEQDVPNHFDLEIPSIRGLPQYGSLAPPPTVIPVSFNVGELIPVRYDPDKRRKLVVDVAYIRIRVIPEWKQTPEGLEWSRQHDPDAIPDTAAMAAATGMTDTAATTETTGTTDADALAKLAELHRSGDLSDEEFAESKRKVLGL